MSPYTKLRNLVVAPITEAGAVQTVPGFDPGLIPD